MYIYIPCILQHSYYVIYYGASIYHIMYLNKNYDLEFVVSFILSLEIHDCISYCIKFMCFVFEITLKGLFKVSFVILTYTGDFATYNSHIETDIIFI